MIKKDEVVTPTPRLPMTGEERTRLQCQMIDYWFRDCFLNKDKDDDGDVDPLNDVLNTDFSDLKKFGIPNELIQDRLLILFDKWKKRKVMR